jgi:hypothetical protein
LSFVLVALADGDAFVVGLVGRGLDGFSAGVGVAVGAAVGVRVGEGGDVACGVTGVGLGVISFGGVAFGKGDGVGIGGVVRGVVATNGGGGVGDLSLGGGDEIAPSISNSTTGKEL